MALTDEELITQSKAGNAVAFEQLIYRYDQVVLNIAARYTHSSEDAKDIYQETFIRVFKGLPKFQMKSEFSTWIFRIATNVCLSHKAKNRKYDSVPIDDGDEEEGKRELAVSEDRTDDHLHGNEITRRIDDALKDLSPQQRLVFTLRHYQDYKLKDISVMMNCAEGTVNKYLFDATHKMRLRLHDLYE